MGVPEWSRPLAQWLAASRVQGMRERIAAKDDSYVLPALSLCLQHGLVAPDWLVSEFRDRYTAVTQARLASWDDAFGRPHPKGQQLGKIRHRILLRAKAHGLVIQRLRNDPSTPIDQGLFESIGKQLEIGKTQAEDLYRAAIRHGFLDGAQLKQALLKKTKPGTNRKFLGIHKRR